MGLQIKSIWVLTVLCVVQHIKWTEVYDLERDIYYWLCIAKTEQLWADLFSVLFFHKY